MSTWTCVTISLVHGLRPRWSRYRRKPYLRKSPVAPVPLWPQRMISCTTSSMMSEYHRESPAQSRALPCPHNSQESFHKTSIPHVEEAPGLMALLNSIFPLLVICGFWSQLFTVHGLDGLDGSPTCLPRMVSIKTVDGIVLSSIN